MDRGRSNRAQAGKSAQVNPGQLEEEDEDLVHEGEMSLGHNGDGRKDAGEEARRQLEAYRKDRQEFKKPNLEGDPAHSGKGSAEPFRAGSPSQTHKLTAELQKAAQASPTRHVYGSSLLKPGGVQRLGEVAAPKSSAPPSVAPSTSVRSPSPRVDARLVLSTAKPMGTFLSEYPSTHPEVSAELKGAVMEAQRLLADVKGVERVAPGKYKGEQVVFIVSSPGLSRDALRAMPQKVQDFKTVISLPFNALPLRRPSGRDK